MIYKLKHPIEVSGNAIKQVDLKEPTFDDISKLGFPTDFDDKLKQIQTMRGYIVASTGLPDEAVGQLKAEDAMGLMKKVADFFSAGA